MQNRRQSGVLLHITSLPGPWGMGELGPQARQFVQWLADAGQGVWQILPCGPAGYGFSPYSALSAFAGNHLMISFDDLIEEGLLTRRQLARFPEFDASRIDRSGVVAAREAVLFRVADRLEPGSEFDLFCEREADWLEEYALFMAIRETQGEKSWMEWPAKLRDREERAMAQARGRLHRRVRRHKILQYLFERHWGRVRETARVSGIDLIGDLPIFVAGDSADVWAHRDLFLLNADGTPSVVAGVPPDYFSETGQRWGNPLYDWPRHRESGYAWWTRRMGRLLGQVDAVRLDHFRGFESFWEIPAEEPTAIHGRWVEGPGLDLFQAMEKNLRVTLGGEGEPFRLAEHIIAENLGIITDEVEALRAACGFAGMWVLQFRFGAMDWHKPGHVPEGTEENQAVYTGTHDNEPVRGWFDSLPDTLPEGAEGEFDFERGRILAYTGSDGSEIHRDFIRLAFRSPARLAVAPMQDVLGLGSEARMNTPGTTEGNWVWRMKENMVQPEQVAWLRTLARETGRNIDVGA